MAEATDYYQVLGLSESASAHEVKQAFRQLARTFHPDRNGGAVESAEQFKAVQEAYETLSDPSRRRAYDRARRNPFRNGSVGVDVSAFGPPRSPESEGSGKQDGYDPLFSYFFGEADSPRPARGPDVETQVHLTFDEALRGGKTELRLADGEPVRLTIPKGVRSGLKVRIRGQGRSGPSGERGDLYVTFRVASNARFRREGDNLHIIETVSALEAILGASRSITNAYGQTVKVHIPAGTQPGERLRLRGQGVATVKRTGDLFVEVQVTIPRSLTDEQRAELERVAQRIGVL